MTFISTSEDFYVSQVSIKVQKVLLRWYFGLERRKMIFIGRDHFYFRDFSSSERRIILTTLSFWYNFVILEYLQTVKAHIKIRLMASKRALFWIFLQICLLKYGTRSSLQSQVF